MGRYDRSFTAKLLQKRLRQGRGQGHGKEYKPWLTVRDVPSRGLSTRIRGWKTGRVHHLLSGLELSYFYILEWSSSVTDIREQYPLFPHESTLAIADRLGIKPPTDPRTKLPIVMTTDFLIDVVVDGKVLQRARTIKKSDDLSTRTLEKLQIERVFWEDRGVDWGIVTEREIHQGVAKNVRWIHCAREFGTVPAVTGETLDLIEDTLRDYQMRPHRSFGTLGSLLDDRFNLQKGSGLWAIRHLISNRRLLVDMTRPLLTQNEVSFSVVSTAGLGIEGDVAS